MISRGIRNNNPFNLKLSKQKWIGKVPNEQNTDGTFEQFSAMCYGLRAGIMTLRNYQRKYGIYELKYFIMRFAPPKENQTAKYIDFVLKHMSSRLCINLSRNYRVEYGSFSFYLMCQAILKYESNYNVSIVDLKSVKL